MSIHYTFPPELSDEHKARIDRQIREVLQQNPLGCECGTLHVAVKAHEPIELDCEAQISCPCGRKSYPSIRIDLTR